MQRPDCCLLQRRATFLKWVLPLDETINFHRLCGYVIFFTGLAHTVCHIANYTVWVGAPPPSPRLRPQPPSLHTHTDLGMSAHLHTSALRS